VSDTPQTDKEAFDVTTGVKDIDGVVMADFARELERENARLQMELDASCNAEEMRQVRAENAVLRSALDQQANYQRELRADRDRLDWLLSHNGGWWAYWLLKYGPWEHDKDELRKQIDEKLKDEA
jgi:transposase-like protein